jgi:hypothetical protein
MAFHGPLRTVTTVWYIKGRTKSVFGTINQCLLRVDAKQIHDTAINIYRYPLHYIRTGNNPQHATWRYHQTPAIMQVSVPSSQPCSVWRIAAGGAEKITSHNRSKDTRCWNYRSVCMHDKKFVGECTLSDDITVRPHASGSTNYSFGVTTVLFANQQLCDSVKNVSHLTSPPMSPTRRQLLRVQSWVSEYKYFYHPMTELLVGWLDNVHNPRSTPRHEPNMYWHNSMLHNRS